MNNVGESEGDKVDSIGNSFLNAVQLRITQLKRFKIEITAGKKISVGIFGYIKCEGRDKVRGERMKS